METEKEYLDVVENIFKKNGYLTRREVIPDECKKWEHPWAIDLVVYKEDKGYLGIESKFLNTLRAGGVLGKAFKQIMKYRSCHFNGIKINRWAISPSFNDNECSININIFIQNFFNEFDVEICFLKHNSILLNPYTKKSEELS